MRQQGAAEPEDGPGSKRPRGYTAEMPEDAYQETADDKNFIDDDGGSVFLSRTLYTWHACSHSSSQHDWCEVPYLCSRVGRVLATRVLLSYLLTATARGLHWQCVSLKCCAGCVRAGVSCCCRSSEDECYEGVADAPNSPASTGTALALRVA